MTGLEVMHAMRTPSVRGGDSGPARQSSDVEYREVDGDRGGSWTCDAPARSWLARGSWLVGPRFEPARATKRSVV